MPRSQVEDDILGVSSAYVQHEPVDLFTDEPSRTRQEFADECDINILMQRYDATGVVSHVNTREPLFLDCDGIPDLQGALELAKRAEEAFMTLPALVRKEFDNDALAFLGFAQDPANVAQMREWGLATPEAANPAQPTPQPPPEGEAGG